MRMLLIFILSLLSHNSYSIHLGLIDTQDISPVGAFVKIEKSDFPYAQSLGYFPSIKVKCSLVRIAKNKAITNTHCIYPYLNQNGKWKNDEHHSVYISFSKELLRTTSIDDIILHKITKIAHQINYKHPLSRQKWDDYMDYKVGHTWQRIIKYFVPRDVAIVEFDINPKEKTFKIAKVKSSTSYKDKINVFVSGYGPDQFDKIENNGVRRLNKGQIVKSIPTYFDNNLISWFVGVINQGGLPTDSGGFIGEIKDNEYSLHSMIVVSPYDIDKDNPKGTKYTSAIKQFNLSDIKWIHETINMLDDLSESRDVQALYNDIMQNEEINETSKFFSTFI